MSIYYIRCISKNYKQLGSSDDDVRESLLFGNAILIHRLS